MTAFWIVTVVWGLSFIQAPAGSYIWLQHGPTFVAMPVLWWLVRHKKIDRVSLAACLTFALLHIVGARWIYSLVPYDDALRWLLGTDTEEMFGWTRNHYDRFVHLMYGVCLGATAWQWHRRKGRVPAVSGWLAIEFVLATSALYEIAEWLAAVTLAPDWADSYLGQQGDMWDGYKDMALAGIGALATTVTTGLIGSKRT